MSRHPEPASQQPTDVETIAAEDGVRDPTARSGRQGQPVSYARGSQVGRYVVLDELGRGGMGVVYSAYDPQLDRRVALKLLHRLPDSDPKAPTGEGLLREGKAMAQLRHPNVISVYDVGRTDDDSVFIAMEFVQGANVRQWLATSPSWRAVRDTFVAAGRGLQAAHAAGLLHRDFKPDNILRDDDGRVLVTDLGLARGLSASNEGASTLRTTGDSTDATTRIAGTPAYMPPEQYSGEASDQRSDVFSFCVALFEGLYGCLPFAGASPGELIHAITSGQIRTPPPGSVPGWLHRITIRGLAAAPEDRWPSMVPLLNALERDPVARWKRVGAFAVVAGSLVGAGMFIGQDAADPWCVESESGLSSLWNDETRTALAAVFFGVEHTYTEDVWTRLQSRLDTHVQTWAEIRADVCASESPYEKNKRMAVRSCLDVSRHSFDVLVATMLLADDAVVVRSLDMIDSGADPADCRNAEDINTDQRPQRGDANYEAWVEVYATLARSKALRIIGKLDQASEAMSELGSATASVPGLTAAVALERGLLHRDQGDLDAAYDAWMTALESSMTVSNRTDTTESLVRLIHLEATGRRNFDGAWSFARLALAVSERGVGPGSRAAVHNAVGGLLLQQARFEEARKELLAGISLLANVRGTSRIQGALRTNLAIARDELGEHDAAAAELRAIADRRRERYGEHHPILISPMVNLSVSLRGQDRYDEALAVATEVLTLIEAAYGDESLELLAPLQTMIDVYWRTSNIPSLYTASVRANDLATRYMAPTDPRRWTTTGRAARAMYESLELAQAEQLVTDFFQIADPHRNPKMAARIFEGRARVRLARKDPTAALADVDRASQLRGTRPPSQEAPGSAPIRASAYLLQERYDDIVQLLSAQAPVYERFGDRIRHHYVRGQALAALGREVEAVKAYETAVALGGIGWVSDARARLALAPLIQPTDPARAKTLVETVLKTGHDYPRYASLHAKATAWINQRPAEASPSPTQRSTGSKP